MKVAIGTLDISDEERRAIRRVLDRRDGASRARSTPATRDETRRYIVDMILSRLYEITDQPEANPVDPARFETSAENPAHYETGHHAGDCHDPDCPMHGVYAMPWLWTEDF